MKLLIINLYIILAEGRLVNLACATGHSSFVVSCSFASQVEAQLTLYDDGNELELDIYRLPKCTDEEIAATHLTGLGIHYDMLAEKQEGYLKINRNGPFKKDDYTY